MIAITTKSSISVNAGLGGRTFDDRIDVERVRNADSFLKWGRQGTEALDLASQIGDVRASDGSAAVRGSGIRGGLSGIVGEKSAKHSYQDGRDSTAVAGGGQ
jgi:hypothetical protein